MNNMKPLSNYKLIYNINRYELDQQYQINEKYMNSIKQLVVRIKVS